MQFLLDSLGAFEDMPTWEEAANGLFDAGLTLNPSELHGTLVGLLASGYMPDADNHLDGTVAAAERALAIDLRGEMVDLVARMNLATLSAIRDSDYAFQPLLPEDDDTAEERLLSVGRWATGFLTGFTQGVSAGQGGDTAVPPDTAETLRDFAAIAQVETDVADGDDADRDLEELIEYLRFAALNVVLDTLNNKEDLS
ncbi:MAG: UPF0149 family protein [Halieaceae bacterium]|jgi:uncharacterized protein YgfB (UPF0149 family)|nr:UPF0149 family protein [Halieaceae bacterium]